IGELFLMRHEENAAQLAAQVLQLLYHHLPSLAIQTAEALVDDDGLNRPMLPAGVLAQSQRQADRNAKTLTAAEEGDVDRRRCRHAVVRLQLQRLVGTAIGFVAAAQTQI